MDGARVGLDLWMKCLGEGGEGGRDVDNLKVMYIVYLEVSKVIQWNLVVPMCPL